MYCKNCGTLMVNGASTCTLCGAPTGAGNSFCNNCGNNVAGATVCMRCGAQLGYVSAPGMVNMQKSKVAAGVLGILLGAFGVHNFYLGFTGKAVAQLLITLLSCGILSFVSAVWGLIDGIMILTGSIVVDARGIPLRD